MNDYKIILFVLERVIQGSNLNDVIAEYVTEENYPKIKNISYNCIRYYYALDYMVNKLLFRKNPDIHLVLIIGVYELWLSEKPDYAVINDLVNYTKSNYNNLDGLVNAILRKFITEKNNLIDELNKDYKYIYNLPDWLITKTKQQYKKSAVDIFKSLMLNPSFGIRVNKKKISQDDYLKLLANEKIEYKLVDNKIVLDKPLKVRDLIKFHDGYVSIQDIAAQYLLDILQKNQVNFNTVLDACAAPGGKTCQLLENYDCNLTALDINQSRLQKIQENLDRLNLSAKLVRGDASKKDWWNNKKFDFVLADVPCSAIGTIKRNPDIKITRKETDIDNFVETQRNIVINLWDVVADNGYMVYSTCSILSEENELNLDFFASKLDRFKVIDTIKILPTDKNDGLFYALIKKE